MHERLLYDNRFYSIVLAMGEASEQAQIKDWALERTDLVEPERLVDKSQPRQQTRHSVQ